MAIAPLARSPPRVTKTHPSHYLMDLTNVQIVLESPHLIWTLLWTGWLWQLFLTESSSFAICSISLQYSSTFSHFLPIPLIMCGFSVSWYTTFGIYTGVPDSIHLLSMLCLSIHLNTNWSIPVIVLIWMWLLTTGFIKETKGFNPSITAIFIWNSLVICHCIIHVLPV